MAIPSSVAFSYQFKRISYGYSYFYDVATDGTNLFIANQYDIIAYRMQTPTFPVYLGALPNVSGNFTLILTTDNYLLVHDGLGQKILIISKPTAFTDLAEFQHIRTLETVPSQFREMIVYNNFLFIYGDGLIVYSLSNFSTLHLDGMMEIYEMEPLNSTFFVATTPTGVGLINMDSFSFSLAWNVSIMPTARMLINGNTVHLYQNNTHSTYDLSTNVSRLVSTGIPQITQLISHNNSTYAVTLSSIYLLDESYGIDTVVQTRILGDQITGSVSFGESLILSMGISGMVIIQPNPADNWEIAAERDLPSNNFRHVGTLYLQDSHYAFAASEWDSIIYFLVDPTVVSISNEMLQDQLNVQTIPWRAEMLSVASIDNAILVSNSSKLSIIQLSQTGSHSLAIQTSSLFGWGISAKGNLFSITNGTHVILAQYSRSSPVLSIVSSVPLTNVSDTYFTGAAIYFANQSMFGRIQMQGTQLSHPQFLGSPLSLKSITDIYATETMILLSGNGAVVEAHPLSQEESPQIFAPNDNGTKIISIPEDGILVAGSRQLFAFPSQSFPLSTPTEFGSATLFDIAILENVQLFLGAEGINGLALFNFDTEEFPDFSLFLAILFLSLPVLLILIVAFTIWKRYRRKRHASSPDMQVLDEYFRN